MMIKVLLISVITSVCFINSPMANEGADAPLVMEGTPPTRDSQATMKNYRDYPFSGWTFQNMGAPLNVVMVPRG